MYKLIAKVQGIKVDQNSTKPPQKHEKDFAGNVATPPPHLNLIMSTLELESHHANKTKKQTN